MSWDPKDDILLKQLKEEQRLGWKEIATHCESQSSYQIYPRSLTLSPSPW